MRPPALAHHSPRSLRYVLPPLAVGAALLLGWPFRRSGFDGISPLCFAAVMVSAWYGGLRAGLLATAFSGFATAFFLMPPAYSLAVDADDLVRIGLFTIGAVLTASLHSATRKATAEALKARAAAEEVNAAQNRFLAMVTHELRGPLNPILLWTGLLEGDERIPEDLRPVLGDIRRNVQMEVRLIDDLLDLVKARHGKLRLQQEYVGVRRLLEAAVDLCRPDLVEKQIEFTLECGDAGLRVYGDPLRLGQVFWNLLRNATKFTPAGGRVRINTRLVAGPSVVVEVSDTGIGIERDRLAAIFEAFEQGGDAIPAVYGGLGLGLAICQAIVNAHGGRIGAASEGRGKGATFTVALPSAGTVFDAQHSPGEVGPNVARAPIAG